jgi:hypothetical protein
MKARAPASRLTHQAKAIRAPEDQAGYLRLFSMTGQLTIVIRTSHHVATG